MKNYLLSLWSTTIHYHDTEKKDLMRTLHNRNLQYRNDGKSIHDMSNDELYDYCKSLEVMHMWMNIYDVSKLYVKISSIEGLIEMMKEHRDFIAAEVFTIPDLTYSISQNVDEDFDDYDIVEEWIRTNKDAVVSCTDSFISQNYHYSDPVDFLVDMFNKDYKEYKESIG